MLFALSTLKPRYWKLVEKLSLPVYDLNFTLDRCQKKITEFKLYRDKRRKIRKVKFH